MNELDKKLFKKAINYLLEGYILEVDGRQLRYYRKGDIIYDDDPDSAYEILENGIFQAFRVGDRSGLFTNWMRMVALDEVNYFFKGLTDSEKDVLFTLMCANIVINRTNKPR